MGSTKDRDLQKEINRLRKRVKELEKRVADLESRNEDLESTGIEEDLHSTIQEIYKLNDEIQERDQPEPFSLEAFKRKSLKDRGIT